MKKTKLFTFAVAAVFGVFSTSAIAVSKAQLKSQVSEAMATADANAPIITPNVATGYVKVRQAQNFPNGEMAVCSSMVNGMVNECTKTNAKTPAQYIKELYPNAEYVGFQPGFNSLQLYYKVTPPKSK